MKSTTYFRNYKILIVTLLILVSFCFSNQLKSKVPENGITNACKSNDSPKANGHNYKHVSDCFNYTNNYAGTTVESKQDTYNGQTVVTKAALDAFGKLVPNDSAIVRLGEKYFRFIFNNQKLKQIENSQDEDFRYLLYSINSDRAAIVKQCPLNEDFKIEKALTKLNDWCAAEWTIAKKDIPISNITTFRTTCKKNKQINRVLKDIKGVIDDNCVLVGCFKALRSPINKNSIDIDEDKGRKELLSKWKTLKKDINVKIKCK